MIKKLLTAITLLFVTNLVVAQSIPNGGFENWTTTTYKKPQFYFVSSLQSNNNFVNPIDVTQDTGHYHGSFSVKLTTMLVGNDTANAYIANGDPSHPIGQGIPISQKPTGMRLYYKCDVMAGDTALILVEFKAAGAVIGQNMQKITGTKNTFTLLNVPLTLSVTPDTLIFAALSSNAIHGGGGHSFKGIPGSMLQIDSLSFTGITSQPPKLNGDFENWQTVTSNVLQNWDVSSTNGNPIQTTDAFSGNFALELKTSSTNQAGDTAYTASATTGHSVFNGTAGGLPYSLATDTLFFNYKYAPANVNDSAEVILMFKKTGFTTQYYSKLLKASSGYLQVAMGYSLTQTPDTLIVFINSSKNNNVPSAYVGSDLKIDNIYLKSQGVAAAALNFDGVNDNVTASVFSTAINNITLEAAVKWNGSTTSNQFILTNGNTGNAGYGIFVDHSNGDKLSAIVGGVAVMSSNAQITAGTWQMVSLVCNSGTWALYVDGVTYSLTANTTIPNPVVGGFAIGSNQIGSENFNGSIDEVRFWNRALCQAEIQNNLDGEVTAASGLIAYYNFNEGIDNTNNSAVTTLNDVSGNSHNATLNNFALTGTTSNWVANGAVNTGSLVPVFTNTISAVATQTNVACNSGATGTASVTVTGVGSPFTYAWSSGGSITNTATGLAANNYTCTINNTCGISTTKTFTITEPAQALMALSTSGTIACNGGATTVTVSATGGTTNYTGTGTFTVTSGPYTYTITDANSCTATTTITVNQPTQLMVTATSGTIACNGGTTTLTVSATGGTPAYTGNVGTFTAVSSGPHTYTVTDSHNCIATTTITLAQPPALTVTATAGTIACNGGTTTVTVVASGGTPTYSGNGTFTVTASPTQYNYIVTDANSCTTSTSVAVSEPTPLTVNHIAGTNVTCNGLSNGSATITMMGGSPVYSYTWSPGAITGQAPLHLSANNLSANNYTCNIMDSHGCTTTTTVAITQPNPIDTSITITPAYFPVLTTNATGATYQWFTCAGSSTTSISGATQQSYTATSNIGPYGVKVTVGSCSASSDCRVAIIEGIANYNQANNLQVYPNPFTNELTITSTAKTNAILFDMLGNKINEFALHNATQTISLESLAPGMYYLQVDNSKIKIIKQ
jgi:hypothetical protein